MIILSGAILVKAQNIPSSRPKVIFYNYDGKYIPPESLDSIYKSFGGIFSLSKQSYAPDSVVYHFKKPEGKLSDDYFLEKAKQKENLRSMLGQFAKDFSATEINGNKYTLSKLKGNVILINFWFTTCLPCIEEIPMLNNLAAKYKKSKVKFLALTFENKPTVMTFLDKRKINLPIFPNTKAIAENYSIILYPSTLVIDKTGKIILAINSSQNLEKEVGDAIDKLL